MRFLLNATGKAVWDLLSVPSEWDMSDGEYTITHKKSGYVFWIANGSWFFDGRGKYSGIVGMFDRHILWQKVKKMRSQYHAAAMKASK